MCAEKRQSRPTLQRVAKHLYRRGNSYEFFRRIPPDAQHLVGVATKSVSFGDVSRREADHLAADLRRETDRLIAQARQQPDPTARVELRRSSITPGFDEIDAVVRRWVLDQETRLVSASGPDEAKQVVRDMRQISDMTPVHLREGRSNALIGTSWIADSLAAQNGWSLPPEGREHRYLFDRVGRAQREVAVRVRAELNYEDPPAATHAMFDRSAFEKDREAATRPRQQSVPIMDVFERYAAEQEPAPKTRKKWKVALNSLIEHLGHDNAARVAPEDIVGWKDALLAPRDDGKRPRGQGTVRNGYVGAAKPVFQWAVDNRLIASNPAAGIKVSVPRRRVNRIEKGYSKAEAEIVLAATLAVDWESDGTFVAFARRWLTGTRSEGANSPRSIAFHSAESEWWRWSGLLSCSVSKALKLPMGSSTPVSSANIVKSTRMRKPLTFSGS